MGRESSVSVVMATHNRASVLPRAIESVLSQLLPQDELIVIDDGSTDTTAEVFAAYADRVRCVVQDKQGPSVARNHGLRLAIGDYIAFSDDDDEYLPYRIHAQRTVLDHFPDVVYAFTNFSHEVRRGVFQSSFIQESGPQFDQWVARQTRVCWFGELGPRPDGCPDFRVVVGRDYATQLEIEYAVTGVLMVRRSLAGDDLRFSEDISSYLDWDLTSRLAQKHPVAYLDADLYRQHIPPSGRIMGYHQFVHSGNRLKVLHRVWGQDQAFLAEHGDIYHARCDREHLLRARQWIADGNPREASRELDALSVRPPVALRLLSRLPSPLLSALMGSRRALKRALGLSNKRHHRR